MARRRTTRGSAQERGHSGSLLSMKLQDCQEHIDESLEPIKMGKEDFLFYLKIIQQLRKDKKEYKSRIHERILTGEAPVEAWGYNTCFE